MLPNYFYNNNYQIVQTKDHVMILVEMVHDARDHPDGRRSIRPPHVRQWLGDSIGRWEGDTLVVETTNFHPLQSFRGASENLKVTERFTRVERGHDSLQVHHRRSDDVHAPVERRSSLHGASTN